MNTIYLNKKEGTLNNSVEGYSRYIIFADGWVYDLLKERFLTIGKKINGYPIVRLINDDGQSKIEYLHRMVAKAFIGAIPQGYTVNHKNEIKNDNRAENLEIITMKENCNYGTRNQKISKANVGKTKPHHVMLVQDGGEAKTYKTLTAFLIDYPNQNRFTWHYRFHKSKSSKETYNFIYQDRIIKVTPMDEDYKNRVEDLQKGGKQ